MQPEPLDRDPEQTSTLLGVSGVSDYTWCGICHCFGHGHRPNARSVSREIFSVAWCEEQAAQSKREYETLMHALRAHPSTPDAPTSAHDRTTNPARTATESRACTTGATAETPTLGSSLPSTSVA